PRAQRADGGGDPGDEAAATDRDHYLVGIGQIRGDLQADSALARYDGPVVERRDERIAVAADQLVGGGHPRRQGWLGGDDLGPQPADGVELDRRRVVRDDHGGRHAQPGRGVGNGPRVVPAGVGHYPPRAHLGGKGADRRVRAAQLERSRRLQRLRLEPQAGVRAGERHERGPEGDPVEPGGRGPDFIDRDQRRHWPTLWPGGLLMAGRAARRTPNRYRWATDFRKSGQITGLCPDTDDRL